MLLGWGGLATLILVVFMVTDYCRTNVRQAFTIPSGSMMDTLLVGDYILVDRAVYRREPPRRGDIVVFSYPADERRDYIFRIVGMPRETLQIRGRQVLIDGRELAEPYVRGGPDPSETCAYRYGCEPLVVPADAYVVMGDNRNNANDSRFWGFVKREKIKGRAAMIYWSWSRERHWLHRERLGQRLS